MACRLIDKWVHGCPSIDACVHCFWMNCAGLAGRTVVVALPPGLSIDRYKSRLRTVLGLDVLADRLVVNLTVPSTDQHIGTSVECPIKALNPREAIADELNDRPELTG